MSRAIDCRGEHDPEFMGTVTGPVDPKSLLFAVYVDTDGCLLIRCHRRRCSDLDGDDIEALMRQVRATLARYVRPVD